MRHQMSTNRLLLLLLLGALCVLCLGPVPPASAAKAGANASRAGAAPALPPTGPKVVPKPDDVAQRVREHNQRADQHFQERQYERCIQELEAAYVLDPDPLYLFNIAQSYRRLRRHKDALAAYRRFLSQAPTTPLKTETQSYMVELDVLIQQEETLHRERTRPLWKKPWFWGILGSAAVVVGVSLGAGLTLGLRTQREDFAFTF